MFRLWGKIWKNNHLVNDVVICDERLEINRTKKVFDALESVCCELDLSNPLWLDSTIEEFKRRDKVKFNKDNFIDDIDFDFLEIHVIEED